MATILSAVVNSMHELTNNSRHGKRREHASIGLTMGLIVVSTNSWPVDVVHGYGGGLKLGLRGVSTESRLITLFLKTVVLLFSTHTVYSQYLIKETTIHNHDL